MFGDVVCKGHRPKTATKTHFLPMEISNEIFCQTYSIKLVPQEKSMSTIPFFHLKYAPVTLKHLELYSVSPLLSEHTIVLKEFNLRCPNFG